MITFKHRGNFSNTERFFSAAKRLNVQRILAKYGKDGVTALAAATPKDSGVTAESWNYEISVTTRGYSVCWVNSHTNDGVPIVILIQYGHGTGNGGYVEGRDFINPAIKPIMEKIAEEIWREVTKL